MCKYLLIKGSNRLIIWARIYRGKTTLKHVLEKWHLNVRRVSAIEGILCDFARIK